MYVKSLKLENFRNYDNLSVEFHPGVNILIGDNAQGKTNMLEAIYALSLTRSHRTNNDRELINWQEKSASISGVVQKASGRVPLELQFTKEGKRAKVNHLEQARLQLTRTPRPLPNMKINPDVKNLFDFKYEDFELEGYNPYDHIKAEVSV